MPDTMTWRYAALSFVAAVIALFVWLNWPEPVAAPGTTVIATPAKVLLAEPTTQTPAPKVIYRYRDAVKTKLKLPEAIINNKAQQVIASSKVSADDHAHTVTTILDMDTGKFATFDRRDTLPLLAIAKHGEAGIAYGIRNSTPIARLYITQDILQAKSLYAGVMATFDQDGQTYAGVRVGYRW